MKQRDKYIVGVLILIVIGILIFQSYLIIQLREDLINTNLEIMSSNKAINSLNSDVNILEQNLLDLAKESSSQISSLSFKLEESAIDISELREDVSSVQVRSRDFSGIVEEVLESVVSIITDRSQGSGAIISEDGYIVTNYHVIRDARRISILTYGEETFNAEVVGIAKSKDVALLKINRNGLDFLDFGDSDDVRIGQRAIALGNPAGLSFTVTEGIISAVDRETEDGVALIQIDVPINPGNSGGPLVNINKEIIGINNFKIGGNFESLGFAITSNEVKDVVDKIFEELEKQEA